jgi:hypothetical protein
MKGFFTSFGGKSIKLPQEDYLISQSSGLSFYFIIPSFQTFTLLRPLKPRKNPEREKIPLFPVSLLSYSSLRFLLLPFIFSN